MNGSPTLINAPVAVVQGFQTLPGSPRFFDHTDERLYDSVTNVSNPTGIPSLFDSYPRNIACQANPRKGLREAIIYVGIGKTELFWRRRAYSLRPLRPYRCEY